MIIGCVSVIQLEESGLAGIKCPKRGVILPGGKWRPGETYKEAASREVMEEVGIMIHPQSLDYVHSAMVNHDAFSYIFFCKGKMFFNPIHESDEGIPVRATVGMLMDSAYKGFYEILFEIIRGRLRPRDWS